MREPARGGYRIERIYQADPDYPDERAPLADPYLDVRDGDVITAVNGVATLSVPDIGELLRDQAGKQVLLTVSRDGAARDVVAVPIGNESNLRYTDWEYSRRLQVEKASDNRIGYVHLRAMGGSDVNQWYREFYPVFDRQGLIIDVRHNRGGNIDSFILDKLHAPGLDVLPGARRASPRGTCSTPSAATWWCWWTPRRRPTARRSPRASGGSGSAR